MVISGIQPQTRYIRHEEVEGVKKPAKQAFSNFISSQSKNQGERLVRHISLGDRVAPVGPQESENTYFKILFFLLIIPALIHYLVLGMSQAYPII